MYRTYSEIRQAVQRLDHIKTIAVAMADDVSVLSALKEAHGHGLAEALLVGDGERIRAIAGQVGFAVRDEQIIEALTPEEIARQAVELVRTGQAEVLMKGHISTPILMKAVLDRNKGLRKGDVLSHVAVSEIPTYPKLQLLSDGGINILPPLETKIAILHNAVYAARHLGVTTPKIAALCPIETVNPKIAETLDAAELAKMAAAGNFGDVILEGPIAMDVALSAQAAERKGIASRIAGDVDIILVPNITAGNGIIKVLMFLANARVGGVVIGAKVPIILLSRADSPEEKLNSIALSILMC